MKQKDIILILVICFISAVASLIVSRLVFATPENRQQAVEVVPVISPEFPELNSRYFNPSSIDPTQLIQIGDSTNNNPFNGAAQ